MIISRSGRREPRSALIFVRVGPRTPGSHKYLEVASVLRLGTHCAPGPSFGFLS